MMTDPVDLSATCGPLRLKSPILAASGCFAYGQQFANFTDLRQLGGLSTKGISPLPRHGNPLPRICETASGMLNSIGLENVGVEAFLRDKLPFLRDLGISVWVNFFGTDFDTYVECARALSAGQGVDALEMNISCPNIKKGGIEFGTVPEVAHRLTRACVEASRVPIVVKLTPNVSDIVAMADAVKQAGAIGVSLINTITGMAIDVRTRRPRLANITGGLSGPAVHPIAVKLVHDVHRAVAKATTTPIVGIGGVLRWEDAAEFILAGATAVEMGTALFADPRSALKVVRGLDAWVRSQGVASITDLVGAVKLE